MKTLHAIAAITLVALTSQATPLLTEDFNYLNGVALTNAPGSTWLTHGGGSTPLIASNGAAFIHQNDATSGRDDYNAPLSATFNPSADNTSVLYSSFTVYFTALPFLAGTATAGSYFAHFKSSASSEFYARVSATTTGAAAGSFRLGIANESAAATFFALDLNLLTTYTIVTRLDLATDKATLWVNPLLETDTSVTDSGAISYAAGSINAYALRQGTSGTSPNFGAPGDIFVDNLKVATSFGEVTAVPEPATLALLGLGSLALLGLRRKH